MGQVWLLVDGDQFRCSYHYPSCTHPSLNRHSSFESSTTNRNPLINPVQPAGLRMRCSPAHRPRHSISSSDVCSEFKTRNHFYLYLAHFDHMNAASCSEAFDPRIPKATQLSCPLAGSIRRSVSRRMRRCAILTSPSSTTRQTSHPARASCASRSTITPSG